MSGTSRPSDSSEPISFDALTEKFQELRSTPESVEAIAIEDEMKRMRNELVRRIGAQKSKILESQELFEEISKSIRRVQGVQKTDVDAAAADRNKQIISESLHDFEERMNTIFVRWQELQRSAGSSGNEPAPAHAPVPAHHEPSGHGGHKKDNHGKKSEGEPSKLPDHKWKEWNEDEEKPILDFPALELQKLIEPGVFTEVYKLIAQGDDHKATMVILNLFSENGNFSDRDRFMSFVDTHIPNSVIGVGRTDDRDTILQRKFARFNKLWTEKLWQTVFETIKQAVTEDIAQSVEKSLALDKLSKTGIKNRVGISGSRTAKQIAASAIAMAVPATAAKFAAGALVSAVGAPAFLTGAAVGLGAMAGRRAITGWWDWASDEYKKLGEEGEEKKSREKKKKEKTKILADVSQDEISLRMASWISQALRDGTAKEAAKKDKTAGSGEKTGLRPDDDANLYILRMNAASELRRELSSAGHDVETAIKMRTAKLDQLINGLNGGRFAAPAKHEEAKEAYEKKAGLKSAQHNEAMGEFGAEADKADKEKKDIGTIKILAVGATIGAGVASGGLFPAALTAAELIPTGITLGGFGYGAYERAKRGDYEHIKKQFERNEEKSAEEAKSLIKYIYSSLKEGDATRYDFAVSNNNIFEAVKQLEVMLASGAFAKNKSVESLVRNAIHDGRRVFGLKHLEKELSDSHSARDKKTVEKETKRLTKKKFNWNKVVKPLVGLAIIVSANFGSVTKFASESLGKLIGSDGEKDPSEQIDPLKSDSAPDAEGEGTGGGPRPVVEESKPQKSEEEIKKEKEKIQIAAELLDLRKLVLTDNLGKVTYAGKGIEIYNAVQNLLNDTAVRSENGTLDQETINFFITENNDENITWLADRISPEYHDAFYFLLQKLQHEHSAGDVFAKDGYVVFFDMDNKPIFEYDTRYIYSIETEGTVLVITPVNPNGKIYKLKISTLHYNEHKKCLDGGLWSPDSE